MGILQIMLLIFAVLAGADMLIAILALIMPFLEATTTNRILYFCGIVLLFIFLYGIAIVITGIVLG